MIFGLAVSGKGVVSSFPGNFGIWVSCSRSIIVLSVLMLVTGSMEGNFVFVFSTCFIFVVVVFVDLLEICDLYIFTCCILSVRRDFSRDILFVCIVVQCWIVLVCQDMLLSATVFFSMLYKVGGYNGCTILLLHISSDSFVGDWRCV